MLGCGKKAEELGRILADEALDAEETQVFVVYAFGDGANPTTGAVSTRILLRPDTGALRRLAGVALGTKQG